MSATVTVAMLGRQLIKIAPDRMSALSKLRRLALDVLGLQRQYVIRSPNEAVNLELQLIYVAIPKAGSSSIRAQVSGPRDYLLPHQHLNIEQIALSLDLFMLYKRLGGNWKLPGELVASHAEIMAESAAIFEKCFKFSIVRNPWARAVSLYFRAEGVKSQDSMDFSKFVERHTNASDTCVMPSRHKNQADWLEGSDGTQRIDYVGKVENVEQAIRDISESTNGRISLSPMHINFNPNSRSRNYKDMYDARLIKLISKSFEKDIDIYKYTF